MRCPRAARALLTQVRTFTEGAISPIVSVLVAASILLVSDLLGGIRSVAYTGEPRRYYCSGSCFVCGWRN